MATPNPRGITSALPAFLEGIGFLIGKGVDPQQLLKGNRILDTGGVGDRNSDSLNEKQQRERYFTSVFWESEGINCGLARRLRRLITGEFSPADRSDRSDVRIDTLPPPTLDANGRNDNRCDSFAFADGRRSFVKGSLHNKV
ncbi:hypothetical protein EVAR_97974_1 [Eumeta japonica]|uniref:Uncharacterized protein n=1 Tax=Eumeta variegata TaxID=151549 RepID=A0A4C1XI77_EUMVA|nr:hypothetical protein EVAR_97974_1 [Eumeta japonica]